MSQILVAKYGKIEHMKRLAIFIRILKLLISLTGILMFVGWLVAPNFWTKPLSYLATVVFPYVPDFFRLVKVNFSLPLVLAYEVFLIIALVLGIDLNWYSEILVTADNDSYYDKIVHFFSGVLVAAVAQELFALHTHRNGDHKNNKWFQALFLMGAIALVAVGWECYEFLYDQIFGGHMQELVKSGVADTMWDMIAALIGGGICVIYILGCQKSRIIKPKSRF
jgi:uncharacterized membrane protein YjdF